MDLQSTMSSQEFFNKQQTQVMKRSTFDRSHTYKTTFNAGNLIPFYVDEALPSDTVSLESRAFGRLAFLLNQLWIISFSILISSLYLTALSGTASNL